MTNETKAQVETLDVVFDGPPSRESGRFVEVEIGGRSVRVGEWTQRPDGFWALRIPISGAQAADALERVQALEVLLAEVCAMLVRRGEMLDCGRGHGGCGNCLACLRQSLREERAHHSDARARAEKAERERYAAQALAKRLAEDALFALAGAVPTPAEGYLAAPHCLSGDVKTLRARANAAEATVAALALAAGTAEAGLRALLAHASRLRSDVRDAIGHIADGLALEVRRSARTNEGGTP